MISVRKWALFPLVAAFFFTCSESPADIETDPPTAKSVKRGLAYNLTLDADLDALKAGLSWWYNWHFGTAAPADYSEKYNLEFIPMLWGRNAADAFTRVKSFCLSHPEVPYSLVMHEPNLVDQANRFPAQAAGMATAKQS